MGVRPDRSDLAVSAGLVAAGVVEVFLGPVEGQSRSERIGEVMALVVIAGCFSFRRSLPVWSAVLALFGLTVFSITGADSRAWEIAVVIIAVYSCARHSDWRGAWTVLGAAVIYGLVVNAIEGGHGFWMFVGNMSFYLALMVLIPWSAGVALRRREQLSRYDAERAVDDERARIARELHDVVGHALGVIVVQADGDRRTCRTRPGRHSRRSPVPPARHSTMSGDCSSS
jgi:signal transduction histidine kinase